MSLPGAILVQDSICRHTSCPNAATGLESRTLYFRFCYRIIVTGLSVIAVPRSMSIVFLSSTENTVIVNESPVRSRTTLRQNTIRKFFWW